MTAFPRTTRCNDCRKPFVQVNSHQARCPDCRKTSKASSRTVDEPYKALATALLYQAVRSWRHGKCKPEKREELIEFFASRWCEIICDLARIEYPAMIEALGMEK